MKLSTMFDLTLSFVFLITGLVMFRNQVYHFAALDIMVALLLARGA